MQSAKRSNSASFKSIARAVALACFGAASLSEAGRVRGSSSEICRIVCDEPFTNHPMLAVRGIPESFSVESDIFHPDYWTSPDCSVEIGESDWVKIEASERGFEVGLPLGSYTATPFKMTIQDPLDMCKSLVRRSDIRGPRSNSNSFVLSISACNPSGCTRPMNVTGTLKHNFF